MRGLPLFVGVYQLYFLSEEATSSLGRGSRAVGYDQDLMEEKAVFRWYAWPWGLWVIGDIPGWFYVG